MFKFQNDHIEDIHEIVRDAYGDNIDEVTMGLRTLEKLMSCKVEGDEMPSALETGFKILVNIETTKNEKGNFAIEVVEGVLRKIINILKKNNIRMPRYPQEAKKGIARYYYQLDVMSKLNASYAGICNNRGNVELHSNIATIPIPDRKVWGKTLRNEKMCDYVSVWKYRNYYEHYSKMTKVEKTCMSEGFFVVLIDICNQYREVIEKYFFSEIEDKLKKFKKEKKENLQKVGKGDFYEKQFTKMKWGDEYVTWSNDDSNWKTILLLGEAGAGKTTQMEKLYWDELKGERITLPIWIKVQDLSKEENIGTDIIEKCIKKEMGTKLDAYYEDCLIKGYCSLYIDGLNELLGKEKNAGLSPLRLSIQQIRKNYPEARICMTDREDRFKTIKKKIYSYSGMDKKECMEYCEKYWGKEGKERVLDFLNNTENSWFWENITPEKINALHAMLKESIEPVNVEDYQYKYVEHILIREYEIKCDERVDYLIIALQDMARAMGAENSCFPGDDITELFAAIGGGNKFLARELFYLACELSIIEEKEDEKYGFTYPAYYKFFNRKGIINICH